MRVLTLHQHDPCFPAAGGISTFINSFLKYAPADFRMALIGVSAEPRKRPVGRWQKVQVGGRECDFLPVAAVHPTLTNKIPVTLRLMWGLRRYFRAADFAGATLTFHRIEPSWMTQRLPNPKVLFLHGHVKDLYNPMTEVKWAKFPGLYLRLEGRLIRQMRRVYIVREDAVGFYRDRYPSLSERISFLPTWVDDEIFTPLPEPERLRQRQALARANGFEPSDPLFLFVGRFERAKDPMLLLEAFRRAGPGLNGARLILIGDGSLQPAVRDYMARNRMDSTVRLIGSQAPSEVARWMNISDCLCLSSAFEGMPIAVLEALSCGLPVVCPRVGEVGRVMGEAACGRVVNDRTPDALAQAMEQVVRQPRDREACHRQAAPYTARRVLDTVYPVYRELAAGERPS